MNDDVFVSNLLTILQRWIHLIDVDDDVEELKIAYLFLNHRRMLNSTMYGSQVHPINRVFIEKKNKWKSIFLVFLKLWFTKSLVCVPTLCKWTAFELNHSAGGNCAENVSICLCFDRPLLRNNQYEISFCCLIFLFFHQLSYTIINYFIAW